MSILIFGCLNDPHIRRVATQLIENNQSPIMIDAFTDISDFKYHFSNTKTIVCLANDDFESVNAIYWRNKPQMDDPDTTMSIAQFYQFQEIGNFLFPLDSITNTKCINPMQVSLSMENKIFQLSLAVKCNFQIPDTIVSGNKNHIAKFINDKPEEFIEKSLGLSWTVDKDPGETHLLNMDALIASSNLPAIIQKRIHRQTELRVYVIENRVIPVEIIIDPAYKKQVDWRSINYDVRSYKRCELSNTLETDILKYHHHSGLIYAAYDIIIDEEGKAYFLDCNPSGNWAFLPDDISNEIVNAICEILTMESVS